MESNGYNACYTPVIFFLCDIFNVCGGVLEFAEKMPSVSETAASIYVNWWANEIKTCQCIEVCGLFSLSLPKHACCMFCVFFVSIFLD